MAEDRSTEEPEWMQLAWQLAGEIRQRRRDAGLSQPRLAARIGYTKQYVSLAERPQRGLPSATLVQAIDDTCVASGLARRKIYTDNWENGLELIQLAFTAGDALSPNAIPDLHTVSALAYARKQDDRQCHRYIGAAVEAHRPDSVSDDPFWLNFTPAQLERDSAFARYDLVVRGAVGDHTTERLALIGGFSSAFHLYPADWVLFKAIISARQASLLCLEGEQRLAHQRAEDAITLAGQVRSARLADDLRVLLRVLPTGDSADEDARDLCQRLSLVLTEMT